MSKRLKCTSLNISNYNFLRDRELGFNSYLGFNDDISRKIYTNLNAYAADIPASRCGVDQGGIFNLEFSLDG